MRKNTLCMTVVCRDGAEVEVHMLNPKDSFPNFGGSKHSLVPGKTASAITRTKTAMHKEDIEHDIYSPDFWKWIARLINKRDETITATVPE